MARLRPRLVNKQVKKHSDGKCYFCLCTDYNVLNLHRIVEGANGGRYTDYNTVTVCANCHNRIHTGEIKILGKHFTTAGTYVIHYLENGVEKFQ